MTRNQVRRVEIACPIENKDVKAWFLSYLEILLSDNQKARRLLSDGTYIRIPQGDQPPVSVQQYYLDFPPSLPLQEPHGESLWKKLFHR